MQYNHMMGMRKKKDSKVIFSNDDQAELSGSGRGNRPRGGRLREIRPKIKTYQFQYGFNDYLKLALAKILPRQNGDLTLIPQRKIIIGEEDVCKQLMGRALTMFQTRKFKFVYFKNEYDLDEIEYWLEEGAVVYRPGVIEVALKQLEKKTYFVEDCAKFRKEYDGKHLILLNVSREKVESALATINRIVRKETDRKQEEEEMSSSNCMEGETIVEEEQNYYQQHRIGQEAEQNSNITSEGSGMQSILQSSYAITENDSSLMGSSFCVYRRGGEYADVSYNFGSSD